MTNADLLQWITEQIAKLEKNPGLSNETRELKARDLQMYEHIKTLIIEKQ